MCDHRDFRCGNCNAPNDHEADQCPKPPQVTCRLCYYTKDISLVNRETECDYRGRYYCPRHESDRKTVIAKADAEAKKPAQESMLVTDQKLPGGHLQTLVERKEYAVVPDSAEAARKALEKLKQGSNKNLGVDFTGDINGMGVKKSMAEPKLPLNLIPPMFPRLVAEVLKFGAKKYAPNNWMNGMSWEEVLAGVQRHIQAFREGQEKDPETGLPHLAHASCGLMFMLWYSEGPRNPEYRKFDDRLFRTHIKEKS
jgi:hypothetical protein